MFIDDVTRLMLTCPCAPCRAQRRTWEQLQEEPDQRRPFYLAYLTDQDIDMLKLLGQGLPNKAIGTEVGITEQSVKNRLLMLYTKLGVQDRTQAALRAVALGLVEPH